MNWSPDTFSDCEYKSRIAMIEAIAMEYDDVEEIPDDTGLLINLSFLRHFLLVK